MQVLPPRCLRRLSEQQPVVVGREIKGVRAVLRKPCITRPRVALVRAWANRHARSARGHGIVVPVHLLSERPLTLDDMATALGVARSSISTNVRISVGTGMIQRVSFPSDRRDYYQWAANTWDRSLEGMLARILTARHVAEVGRSVLAPGATRACSRIEDMLEYCDFADTEIRAVLARWRARHQDGIQPAAATRNGTKI